MTIRRPDPSDNPRPHDEFWGEQSEWTPQRPPSPARAGVGATLGGWWNALLGGGATAGRVHGGRALGSPTDDVAPPDGSGPLDASAPRRAEPIATLRREPGPGAGRPDRDEGDLGNHDDSGDEAWEFDLEPRPVRHPGADPLLARLGGFAVIITLAAPLMVGISSCSDSPAVDSMLSTAATTATSEIVDRTLPVAAPEAIASVPAETSTTATPVESTPDVAASSAPPPTTADVVEVEAAAPVAVAASLADPPVSQPAETVPVVTTPPCGGRYEVAPGDYWIRLADAAGVSLAQLLAVNGSSADTVLVPGRSICLPVGASTPSPPSPPTTVAPAAPAPAPSAAPAAPATTSAPSRPTTTVASAPTTTAPSRPAAVSQAQAAAIIRDVWPDDLEEHALEIAWRESNHQSNVNNYCCYGLFQIHFAAHRSWLATIGVTSASQLFDPAVNATAAYTLYQRSGGFGPWGG